MTKPTEKKVATFVDDQIDVIEKKKAGSIGGGVQEEEAVNAEPGNAGGARYRLPIAELLA